MNLLSYRPEIDGLRAIAVIPVILFHFGLEWLSGGYIGVDVFFVISGFLITTILLKDFDKKVFSFSNFWLRRIRRILPVLVVVVFATLIVGQFVLYAPDVYYLGKQGIASLLSYANISQWLTAGNYWGYGAENSPLLHTWSLSVEEQFYLIFPLLIFIALKYLRNWLAPLVFILCILSFALFVYGTKNHPDATFYLLPTRAWELGVGAFLAIYLYNNPDFLQGRHHLTLQSLSLLGLIAVAASYFLIDGSKGLSPLMIIPVIGTGLIIAFSKTKDTFVNKFLSLPVLVYIGTISYSLYLWHWPVLVLSKNISLKTQNEIPTFLLLGLICLLSILSYHFIEKPTRNNTRTVPLLLIAMAFGVIYSYSLTTSRYVEDTSMYNETLKESGLYSSNPSKKSSEFSQRKYQGIKAPVNKNKNWNSYKEGGIVKNLGKKEHPEIVVLGDSHSLMWSSTLEKVAKQLEKSIAFYASEGTPTFFDIPLKKGERTIYFTAEQKHEYDEARIKYLKLWKPEIVIISHNWSDFGNEESTRDLLSFLGSLGTKVFMLEQPPVLFFGDKNAPQFISYYGLKPSTGLKQFIPYLNTSWFNRGRKLVRDIVSKCDYCELIPITDLYIKDDKGWVLDEFDVLYVDDDHLSSAGTLRAKDRIFNALKRRD